ncbi:MAG: cupredoxin domain-containing protein [Acidobacteria bacterium]|nr:cupredoxin domain-containing protein [Acidobacteriota bacterium]
MRILGHDLSRAVLFKVAIPFVGVLLLAVALPALTSTPTREVTLVARGMAFYIEGDAGTPNPTIEVKAGERVRIVLRNDDRGMRHDFAVPALAAAMDALRWNESADVIFDAPETPGTYQYECRPHRIMMRGVLRVY